MNENPQVIVVGGGASGLTAAIVAAQNGATVTVLEQNENPGRKICVSGNFSWRTPGNCTKRFKTVFHGRYTGVFWTDGCGFY